MILKTRDIALVAVGLFLLAGCASTPKTADVAVQSGMSRADLRFYFGEPLRIVPGPWGGEDWYYRFVSLKTRPTGATGVIEEVGDNTSYVSVGLAFSKETEALPIHVSAEGYVISPVPTGKVVKN